MENKRRKEIVRNKDQKEMQEHVQTDGQIDGRVEIGCEVDSAGQTLSVLLYNEFCYPRGIPTFGSALLATSVGPAFLCIIITVSLFFIKARMRAKVESQQTGVCITGTGQLSSSHTCVWEGSRFVSLLVRRIFVL